MTTNLLPDASVAALFLKLGRKIPANSRKNFSS
jgi:hypothetical protein